MTSEDLDPTTLGTDTWCFGGLQTARLASGSLNLAQDIYNTLITRRGILRGTKTAGKVGGDLQRFIGSIGVTAARAALPSYVRSALREDERIASIRTTVDDLVLDSSGLGTLRVRIQVVPRRGVAFSLTLDASSAAVRLVGMS